MPRSVRAASAGVRATRAARALASVATLLCAGAPVAAQGAPCDTPEHRAFDFWVGRWEVRAPDGRLAGHNTIRRAMGGCVLHERYTTPTGYEGESLNMYDASRGVWHQTWTDDAGLLLLLEGGLRGDTMVLSGETVDTAGARVRQRISWWVADDDPDRVRQRWERGTSDGWAVVFDGLYLRREDPPDAPR
mgnify:CR=1 FL=1